MKNKSILLSGVMLLAGCASNVYRTTDTVTLYPASANAQHWGVINFYAQRQSNTSPNTLQITLPNGQMLHGQMLFLEESGHTRSESNSFWRNVHIGLGVGHRIGHHGWWDIGWSPMFGTGSSSYRSDTQHVTINAFGTRLSMNCQGRFNRRQKTGTIGCQLTNGMRYSGIIRRVATANIK